MATRYTDRDCYAALVLLVAELRHAGEDAGLVLETKAGWRSKIADLAKQLGVPLLSYVDSKQKRYGLDHAPKAHGGGVRPCYYENGTGQYTPRWWIASAGLGPGALPAKMFVHIVRAVYEALHERRHAR